MNFVFQKLKVISVKNNLKQDWVDNVIQTTTYLVVVVVVVVRSTYYTVISTELDKQFINSYTIDNSGYLQQHVMNLYETW